MADNYDCSDGRVLSIVSTKNNVDKNRCFLDIKDKK